MEDICLEVQSFTKPRPKLDSVEITDPKYINVSDGLKMKFHYVFFLLKKG